jgi:spore photoproduct lyase
MAIENHGRQGFGMNGLKRIFIERAVHRPEVLARLTLPSGIPVVEVEDAAAAYAEVQTAADPIAAGKETLLLGRNKGRFIRPCPGTREYTCCGYHILNVAGFCSMDCSYCILQTYFHPPILQLYVNQEDLEAELAESLPRQTFRRIGTGEFSDSLIWDGLTDLTAKLVMHFARQDHALLELKTKTVRVGHLAELPHRRRTVMSWSLNTPALIRSNERGTASLSARLKAARDCERWGYPLAFHLDPLVIYPGCEEDYRRLIQHLFEHASPGNIVWISMGSLRYMPALGAVMRKRFPHSTIPYGEMITGLDGKQRYFKPLRMDLYRRLAGWIRERAPDVCLYLCMEDREVWESSLGRDPGGDEGLGRLLDRSAIHVCGLSLDGSVGARD